MSRSERTAYFRVLVTDENHLGLWPVARQPPRGWRTTSFLGTYDACVNHVRMVRGLGRVTPHDNAPSPVLRALRAAAEAHPETPAVRGHAGVLTYRDLLRSIDETMVRMLGWPAGAGDLVVVAGAPSPGAVAVLFASLAVAATCLFIESPGWAASAARTFLVTAGSGPAGPALERDRWSTGDGEHWQASWDPRPGPALSTAQRAGSTGAIAVSHAPGTVAWQDRHLARLAAGNGLGPGDRLSQRAVPGSPVFVTELLLGLLAGAEVALPGVPVDAEGHALRCAPAGQSPASPLRCALTGGPEMLAYPETGMFFADFDPAARIARPLPDTRLHVLDAQLHPVPPGEPGWLYVGGDGVTDGYLDHPEASLRRFLPDPFATVGALMFRTGLEVRNMSGAVQLG